MTHQGFPGQHTTSMTATNTTFQRDFRYDPLYLHPMPGMLKMSTQIGEFERPPLAKRRRRYGSQRKRYKWLRSHGISHEEASKLCLTSIKSKIEEGNLNPAWSDSLTSTLHGEKGHRSDVPTFGEEIGLKRPLSYGPTPPGLIVKRQKLNDPRRPWNERAMSIKPTQKVKHVFTVGIRVGILPTNYPEDEFNGKQVESIKETILNMVVEEVDKTVCPSFYSLNKNKGYLVVICSNQKTADWLIGRQEKLVPWEGAKLKVVPDEQIPIAYTANLDNSIQDSTEKILKLLEAQNEGLKAAAFKVLRREEKGDCVCLLLIVGNATVDSLKKTDFWVSYKFGKIQLRPYKPKKDEDAEIVDVDYHETKAPSEDVSVPSSLPEEEEEPKDFKNFYKPKKNTDVEIVDEDCQEIKAPSEDVSVPSSLPEEEEEPKDLKLFYKPKKNTDVDEDCQEIKAPSKDVSVPSSLPEEEEEPKDLKLFYKPKKNTDAEIVDEDCQKIMVPYKDFAVPSSPLEEEDKAKD